MPRSFSAWYLIVLVFLLVTSAAACAYRYIVLEDFEYFLPEEETSSVELEFESEL